ncbi:MAG TPA: hypothetical protein VMZ25_10520 [Terriglobales bacterium]|nr:hypothetical protein [Terriglobales bacterium]
MSSQSERVDQLIQEHSSLNRPGTGPRELRGQEARVTEIRRELVQILQVPAAE